MIISGAFIKGIHHFSYRSGRSAIITGMKCVQPSEHLLKRLCYEVTFPDGAVDYIPLSEVDAGNYELRIEP